MHGSPLVAGLALEQGTRGAEARRGSIFTQGVQIQPVVDTGFNMAQLQADLNAVRAA